MTTQLNELLEKTQDYQVEYADVQFPVTYDGIFSMGDEEFDGFSPDGMTYLLYRLGKYVNRKHARELYREDKKAFAQYVSLAHDYQISESLREAKRQRYVAAFIIKDDKKMLWGLMTNYNVVSHREVLEKITGITATLSYTRFSPKEMLLFFKSAIVGDNTVEYGLAVRNGETGHAALSYLLAVRSSDYVFTFPTSLRRRHLSLVGEVDLAQVFDTINSIDLHNKMEITPIVKLRLDMSDYPDVLYDEIYKHSRSVAETLPAILKYRFQRGLKVAAEKLADEILKRIGEL